MCEAQSISGVMKQECKTTKMKNKRQVTMTKGDGSAGGQRAQGMICRSVRWAATEASGPWCRIVINEDPEINRQCRKG